jgi:hypothetical protein
MIVTQTRRGGDQEGLMQQLQPLMDILSQFTAAIKPANRGNSAVGGGFAESQRSNGIKDDESATRAGGILPIHARVADELASSPPHFA